MTPCPNTNSRFKQNWRKTRVTVTNSHGFSSIWTSEEENKESETIPPKGLRTARTLRLTPMELIFPRQQRRPILSPRRLKRARRRSLFVSTYQFIVPQNEKKLFQFFIAPANCLFVFALNQNFKQFYSFNLLYLGFIL